MKATNTDEGRFFLRTFFGSGTWISRSLMFLISLCVYIPCFTLFYRIVGNPYGAVAYLLVVILMAWFWGWKAGICSGLLGVLVNIGVLLMLKETSLLINLTLQGAVFYTLVGVVVGSLSNTIRKLYLAQAEIKLLQELMPICAECRKIRDDEGYWHQLESYIATHTNTVFSHGLCPDCAEKYFREMEEMPPDRAERAEARGHRDDRDAQETQWTREDSREPSLPGTLSARKGPMRATLGRRTGSAHTSPRRTPLYLRHNRASSNKPGK